MPIHLPAGGFAFVSGLSLARHGAWRDTGPAAMDQFFLTAHGFHAAVAARVGVNASTGSPRLSRRELEVVQYAARGLSAPATAHALHRALETVRHHRKSAMAKLEARTMTQAVARALSLGLL